MRRWKGKAGLVLAALVGMGWAGWATSARADIINASFETGDLSGWVTNGGSASSVGVAFDFRRQLIVPSNGGFQAELSAGLGAGVATTMSQTFSVANFDLLCFDVFFAAHDVSPFNDSAYFTLDGVTLGTISVSDVGDLGSSGYVTVQVPISEGEHSLEFGVLNGDDNNNSSRLYVDNVMLKDSGGGGGGGGVGGGDPNASPEPGSLALLGLGLAGFAGYGLRRRRQAV